MASFFQPGFDNPQANGNCSSSRFLVFCNSVLPADQRFAELYQTVTLAIGGTAILIPILLAVIFSIVQSWGKKKPRGNR